MKYTVTWKPSAEQELTRLWLKAVDRQAVTDAANLIDRLLQTDPQERGESRSGTAIRVFFVPPLGVFFEVREDDRLVEVLQVWPLRGMNGFGAPV